MAAFRYAKRFAVRVLPGRPVGATGEGDAALGHSVSLALTIWGNPFGRPPPHWLDVSDVRHRGARFTIGISLALGRSSKNRTNGQRRAPMPSVSALAGHPPSCTSLWPRYV